MATLLSVFLLGGCTGQSGGGEDKVGAATGQLSATDEAACGVTLDDGSLGLVPEGDCYEAPRFVQFVDEVFDNRTDLIQFAQRAVG